MCLALSFGAAPFACADKVELGPGSMVYWNSGFGNGLNQFQEKLLVEGDDFAVYQTLYGEDPTGPSDYFALFSGIYFTTCDLAMPTEAEREALAGLRPFEPGAKVEVTGDDGASVVVGEATEFFLMGRMWPAHQIALTYASEDGEDSNEEIVVLDEPPLTVRLDWEDGSRDIAMLVTRPRADAEVAIDQDLIGNCASLLKDPEE